MAYSQAECVVFTACHRIANFTIITTANITSFLTTAIAMLLPADTHTITSVKHSMKQQYDTIPEFNVD